MVRAEDIAETRRANGAYGVRRRSRRGSDMYDMRRAAHPEECFVVIQQAFCEGAHAPEHLLRPRKKGAKQLQLASDLPGRAPRIMPTCASICDAPDKTMNLQIGLAGRDRFLIPFKTNARHVRNVKQSVTNFIGFL